MIQDRLTAKFKSAKQTTARKAKPQPQREAPKSKTPAMDSYAKGRTLSGSFWI